MRTTFEAVRAEALFASGLQPSQEPRRVPRTAWPWPADPKIHQPDDTDLRPARPEVSSLPAILRLQRCGDGVLPGSQEARILLGERA
jgi:hypothetical protein